MTFHHHLPEGEARYLHNAELEEARILIRKAANMLRRAEPPTAGPKGMLPKVIADELDHLDIALRRAYRAGGYRKHL